MAAGGCLVYTAPSRWLGDPSQVICFSVGLGAVMFAKDPRGTDYRGLPSWCGFSGILTPGTETAGAGPDGGGRVRFTFTSDPRMDRTATINIRRNAAFGKPSAPIDVTTLELPPSKETSLALVLYLTPGEQLRIDNVTPVIQGRPGDAHLAVECLTES